MALKFRRGNNAQKSGSLAFGEPYVNTTLGTLQIGLDTGDVTLQVAGSGSVGTFGHISGSSLEISGDATIGGNLTLGGNITIGDQTTDTVQVTANLSSSLIPSNDNTFDLGSTNKKYRDVYVGRNITIDGNTTLGNNSGDTITFSGSVNSNILPHTASGVDTGAQYDLGSRTQPWKSLYVSTGSIYIIGASGNVVGQVGGASGVGMDVPANIQLGGNIFGTGSASSIYMKGNAFFTGSVSASTFTGLGNLTEYSTSVDSRLQSLVSRANNLELDSASQDGRLDNLESTSASLLIETSNLELFSASTLTRLTNIETASGSAIGRLNNLESTSASVNISVGALNTFSASTNSRLNNLELDSASQDSRLDNLEAATSSYETKGNNIVSGSSNTANVAISINSGVISANLTGGVISGSAQLTAGLPENVVSASTDTANVDITITAGNISANLKGGVVSGSSQIDATQTTNWASGIKTQLDTNTVVSSSAQVVGILGSLNTYTQSNDTTNANQNARLTSLETASGSAIGRLNNLETTSASVNTSISNLNLYTASNNTTNTNQNNRLNSIEGYTSSLKTAIDVSGTNLTVFGDLTVQGTTTQINSTQVNIGENILELNYGGSANTAGIYTKDATGASTVSGSLLWDATNDRWIAGKKDAEAKVLTDGLGVISGSGQLAASLPDNVVSASTDTANVDITISSGVISANLKGGVVSGSSQIDATQTTNWATGIKTQLDANTVVSGSAQVIGILNSLNSYTASNDTTNTTQNSRLDQLSTASGSAIGRLTSLETASGSAIGRLNSLEAATSSYETKGRNIVSSSTDTANVDITITDGVISANLKGGVISGSGQLAASLPENVVSASTDTANVDITITAGNISANLKGGVVSGSSQIDATATTNWATGIKTQLNSNTVVSGSSQITYSGLSGIPAGIVSGAAQVTPLLPAGTISGSSQVTGIGNAQLTNSSITIAGTSTALGSSITLATITGGSGILSGSSQLGGIYETTGRNIVSASTDSANIDFTITNGNLTADLKGGVISSSTQIVNYGIFATTGSNTFIGNQTITGSLRVTGDLTVLGSSSIQNISSSTLNIGTNLITVAVNQPSVRFGGIAVIDSGSAGGSGSFLYDSIQDEFIFVHRGDGTNITSSHFLMGPETYNDLGNENYLTNNKLPKGTGKEHLVDSNITDNGTTITLGSNTVINGTIVATGTTLVSGSSQITYSSLSGIPAGIVSGAAQVTPLLPTGTVSGSSQVSYTGLSNIPAGIISSSAQLGSVQTAVTSSYPINITGSWNQRSLYSVDPAAGPGMPTVDSIIFGNLAGETASDSTTGVIFIGTRAGRQAPKTAYSVFIGQDAGGEAIDSSNAVMIGLQAGQYSSGSDYSVIIGPSAAQNTDYLIESVVLGLNTAQGATNASRSVFIGTNAGASAANASFSTFIGYGAGGSANGAYESNFIGFNAGDTATDAWRSNFIGYYAGSGSANAHSSNFIGREAGANVDNAFVNAIGYGAGKNATNAASSNFIGAGAGQDSANASYSVILGTNAGKKHPTGNGISSNNIIIGSNVSLPNDRKDSINFGGIIFATGSHSNMAMDAFTGSVGNGKVGINVVLPDEALHVSGNIKASGNLLPGSTTSTLGTAANPWKDLYVSTGSIYIIGASGNIVTTIGGTSGVGMNIPSDLQIGGNFYGTGSNSSIYMKGNAEFTGSVSASTFTGLGNLTTYSTSVDSRIVSLVNETTNLELTTASLNTSVSNLNSFSSSQLTKDSTLGTYTASVETRFSTLGTYTSSVETRFSTLATTTGSINTSITNLNSFTASVSTASLVTSISNLNSFSSSQLTKDSTLGTYTGSIDTKFSTLAGVTASYDNRFSTLATYTGSNDTTNTTQNSRLDQLSTASGSAITRLSTLETFTGSFNTAFGLSGTNVTVKGNLTVQGTTTQIDSTTVNITDNIIQLNGTGATNAGIVVRDATAATTTSGSLLWDTTNDKWIAGPLGSEDDVVLRTTSQTLTNKTISGASNTLSNIANASLTNSSITIAGTSVSLGGSITLATITGGSGIVSGSSQVSYASLTGIPAGIVSGSSQISHDSTTGYSANRHVDHTAVSITAGSGLNGGGDISTTRTLSVNSGSMLPYYSSSIFSTVAGDITINSTGTATIAANSVALGTDTTGDYVASLVAGTNITLSNNSGEGATPTIGLTNNAITIAGTSTSLGGSITLATITGGSGIISGSSQVQAGSITGDITLGTQTSGNYVATITAGSGLSSTGATTGEGIAHTISIPNSGVTNAMLANSAITIAGTSTSLGGSITAATILQGTGVVSGSSQITYANISSIPAGIVSGAAQVTSLLPTGTVSGSSQVYSGVSGDITIASNGVATIAANSVALGTDTTGNYMSGVSAGNAGIVISHTPAEGSSATISLVSGVVSGSAQIDVASTTGDIALGTRTSGNYVASLVAGTNITLTNNTGEGATPTIGLTNNAITIAGTSTSLGGSITLATITGGSGIISGSSQISGLTTSNLSGTAGITNGQLANSSVTVTAGTGMSGGGSVSLGSSITLTNAGVTSNVAGSGISVSGATGAVTITNTGVRSIAAGTGVSVSATTGDSCTISIGQSVATGASPTFAGLTINGSITATGDITAYYSSDKRFKDNIVEIDGALDKVRKIRGVKWTWNDLADDVMKQAPTTGLIAQEVQEVLPEVVKEREDGYLGLDYAKMMGLMVEAIKEQQLQIEKLQIELNNCKNNKGL